MKTTWNWISFVLFIIGLIFSVVGGIFFAQAGWVAMLLAILGLIIGLIYVFTAKDIKNLLLASIALLAMTAAFAPITFLGIGKGLESILVDFAALVAPMALVSALKALIMLGIDKE